MALETTINLAPSEVNDFVLFNYTFRSDAASTSTNAKVMLDVSTLDGVDAVRITDVMAVVGRLGVWSQAQNGIFILDSNNTIMLHFDEGNCGKFCWDDGRLQFPTSKEFSANANGNLLVAVGASFNATNGQTSAGGIAGDTYSLTIRAQKIYK